MQRAPLQIKDILEYGRSVYGRKKVFTVNPEGFAVSTFAEIGDRAAQLAHALRSIGVQPGDRVATFMWNNQRHLEAYLAIPSMGAVLHTLNIRLFPDQLSFIINHAEDKVLIIDESLVPLFLKFRDSVPSITNVIVASSTANAIEDFIDYENFIALRDISYDWPILDEETAAGLCYTSGTTGNPKGVVYSHRSTYLHSLSSSSANSLGISDRDRTLLVVPMFHVNAWGAAYTAFMTGSDLVMPQMLLQGEPLLSMIETFQPTIALGVPTIWNDLLRAARNSSENKLRSLRAIVAGGAAVPRSMIVEFKERHNVEVIQGYGMTETSPLVAVSLPPSEVAESEDIDWRVKAGRIVAGVQVRIVDDQDREIEPDGISIGEIEIRGPWITAKYFKEDDAGRFHDGWLRTGDIGSLDEYGFLEISDRTKDVIKSGGEWISSVALENAIVAHPDVFEAAVISIPDDRWQERPLCCIVLAPEATASIYDIHTWLAPQFAKWWIPEHWTVLDVIPKTSVGKYDKKLLRNQFAQHLFKVITIAP